MNAIEVYAILKKKISSTSSSILNKLANTDQNVQALSSDLEALESRVQDFDVVFKDEYNHEVTAYKAKLVPNRYYVKIPDTVLELPGRLYVYIKSGSLVTGLSNALRVDICYQEETLTNGNNNN